MFANFLIGLREALEASLVVSILVAYVVRTGRRHLLARIWGGVGLAAAISLGFGALLVFGPRGLDDEVEEAIAGVLSVLAVVFVTWMIFWMARAARGMGAELRRRVDSAADAGRWSLAIVALLAVGREGLETALFLWAATSAAVTDAGDAWRALLGAGLGIVTAVVLGWLIYRGALSLDLTRFFTWTGGFLILVAGGVLAYGIHDLQEAGLLPGADTLLFDLSGVIDPSSWYAELLKGVLSLSPTMSVLSGLAWLAYVVPAMTVFLRMLHRSHATPARPAPTPVA
ncbi:MAG: iron uptake transporter permease EfeU [Nocardioides sp.]